MICAVAEFTRMLRVSSVLSLIPSWSGTNALLGALSELAVVVTHVGGSPVTNVAVHPVGNAGGATESKFSVHCPGAALGLGATVAVAVAVGVGDNPGEGDTPGLGDTAGVGDTTGLGLTDGPGTPVPRSYTSTKPLPVPAFNPASKTV